MFTAARPSRSERFGTDPDFLGETSSSGTVPSCQRCKREFSRCKSECWLRGSIGAEVYLGNAATGTDELQAHTDVAGNVVRGGRDSYDVDVLSTVTRNPPRSDQAWPLWRWNEMEDRAALTVTGRAKPATRGEVKTGHLRSDVIL